MMRKLLWLFLLIVGFQYVGHAQVRDSVTIIMPPYTDTTCDSVQLTFTALESSDTFSHVQYHWYTEGNFYTGVSIDTFITTALTDGDSVFCRIIFTNSYGFLDSVQSNSIIIHRSSSIPAGVLISLLVGSNPDCAGHPLTFVAYPVNGGPAPIYQWMINGVPVAGADSVTFTRVFGDPDTVSCMMVSNSPCIDTFKDTVFSNVIPIIHYHLTATINITVNHNPICAGTLDTFNATYANGGVGYTLAWFVNGAPITHVIGTTYITDSLANGNYVYCVLTTPDPCIATDSTVSNVVTMTVLNNAHTTITTNMIHGANPGCIDSPVTYQATYSNFGVDPVFEWFINGYKVDSDQTTLDTFFHNGDIVTFKAYATDTGCYTADTVVSSEIIMLRDSTPPQPWISLIVNELVANSGGGYDWYYSLLPTGPFTLVPGVITQTFHPGNTGYYYAVKDTNNNCFSIPSNVIYIALLGIPGVNEGVVNIYPNPTTGVLNIDLPQAANMKMDIFNIVGQGLLHDEFSNTAHYEKDISYLPEGDYMLVLRSEDGRANTYKIQLIK